MTLPAVNASLNALAFVLLMLGWRAVKTGRIEGHKKLMISAFLVSSAFLVCYLVHKFTAGDVKFAGEGLPRTIYFIILATHVPLATIMIIPICLLLKHGIKGQIDKHKRLARWTLPVWIYVSITGVLIYFMLFVWYAPD